MTPEAFILIDGVTVNVGRLVGDVTAYDGGDGKVYITNPADLPKGLLPREAYQLAWALCQAVRDMQ